MSDSESIQSDVSLDEEDEALIWRVFYADRHEPGERPDAPLLPLPAGPALHPPALPIQEPQEPLDELSDPSDLSDIDDEALVARYRELKNNPAPEMSDDDKNRLLVTSLTDAQMERFEAYRRMRVNKPGVKKIANAVLGHSIPQNIAVVLAGLSKLLLGDVITKAFEVQEQEYKTQLVLDIDAKKNRKRQTIRMLAAGENVPAIAERPLEYLGDRKMPLTADHVREAWRLYRMENSGTIPNYWRMHD